MIPNERLSPRPSRLRDFNRGMSSRQAAWMGSPRFARLRTPWALRGLVVFTLLALVVLVVGYWLYGGGGLAVLFVGFVLFFAGLTGLWVGTNGVTAVLPADLDERQRLAQATVFMRAFRILVPTMFVVSLVLRTAIERGPLDPLDGDQVYALVNCFAGLAAFLPTAILALGDARSIGRLTRQQPS